MQNRPPSTQAIISESNSPESVSQLTEREPHGGQVRRGVVVDEGVGEVLSEHRAPAQPIHVGNALFHLWQRCPFFILG